MSKKMSNAPVYYTLAQAQFNPIAAMENYVNEVQDKLRQAGYTFFELQKITQLHFGTPSAAAKPEMQELPLWRFTKTDRSSGFILGQSHIAYHNTHYQTHKEFFSEFLFGLETIHSVIKLDHLSRLGLRYLNAVLPKKGETVDQYLVNGLHGVRFDASQRYSFHESVFDTDTESSTSKGTLVSRVHCRTGPLGYPPDMAPYGLSPMPKFAGEDNITHAIIDIDHFIEGLMPLNFEQIKTQLDFLHRWIGQAFKATITDHASTTWT